MSYRIMIVVEDLDYDPDSRELHDADAGWYAWIGGPGDKPPTVIDDYEKALVIAEELTLARAQHHRPVPASPMTASAIYS